MLRVTADTNIYISAFAFGGLPGQLLELAREAKIRLCISDEILAEILRVLRTKFGWTDDALARAEFQIAAFTGLVHPRQHLKVVQSDPSDDRILECAAESDSDYIVTGDNHLLQLKQFGHIQILRAAELLAILENDLSQPD